MVSTGCFCVSNLSSGVCAFLISNTDNNYIWIEIFTVKTCCYGTMLFFYSVKLTVFYILDSRECRENEINYHL